MKITFNKNKKDIFITDFRRYSFVLNNNYIPDDLNNKKEFDNLLKQQHISFEELKAYVRTDKYETHRNDKKFIEVCKK